MIILFFLAGTLSFGTAAYADYTTDSLEPLGSRATGASSVSYDSANNQYVFQFTESGGGDVVTYKLPLNETNLQQGLIVVKAQLNANAEIYPVNWGGTLYRDNSGTILQPFQLASAASVSCTNSLAGSVVTISCTDTYQSVSTTKTMTYKLKGKTLVITLSGSSTSGSNNYAGFLFDRTHNTSNVVPKRMTFAEDGPYMMVDSTYFISTVTDKFKSNGTSFADQFGNYDANSAWSSTRVNYEKNSAGTVNALSETAYVTVSSKVLETIYATNKAKSAHRDLLTDKVVWDYWGVGAFGSDYRKVVGVVPSALVKVEFFKNNWKMNNVLMIDHQWQRHDYDQGLPEHYPANPMRGSTAEVQNFVSTVKGYGWQYAFHEDYWFNYPVGSINKYWTTADQAKLAKNANGTYRDAFFHSVTGVMTYAIRGERMKDYSDLESAAIQANYAPNAAYLDVNPAYAPDYLNQVTLDAGAGDSRSLRAAYDGNKALFNGIRSIYSAPLLGEGTSQLFRGDSAYAGFVDGVEREITNNQNAQMIVDYELKAIRPLMANQGMGYRSRYFDSSYPLPSAAEMDRYRAMSIAFAHTGFIGDEGYFSQDMLDNLAGKEYYLMQALQAQYLDTSASVNSIEYWNGTAYRTLDQALKEGYDFTKAKLHIVYDNGLSIYLNFDNVNWTVSVNSVSYTLNANGWVASNPGQSFLAYSALKSGNRVDYVDAPSYTMVDGRGVSTNFGTITTDGMRVVLKSTGDTTAPVIRNVTVKSISGSTAVVSWTTDEPASAEAEYGTTTSYGSKATALLNFKQQQQVTLANLSAGTTYHIRVKSYDISGNAATGPDIVFKTLPAGNGLGSQFSLTQGSNNWSYQYWDGTNYGNLSSNGTYWYLPSDPYAMITSYSMATGTTHDSALKWTAPASGWIRIEEMTPESSDSYNGNGTDGVILTILHNDEKLLEDNKYASRKKANYFNLTRYVNAGDAIYIRMNKKANNYFDEFLINPTITYLSQSSYTASTEFAPTMGGGQWYYRYWDGTNETDMTYDSPNARWSGSGARITSDALVPSSSADADRVWIAPVASEVLISGTVRKKVIGGDGVTATILVNGRPLWTQAIGASDTTGFSPSHRAWVEAGDRIVFRVNRGGTAASDDTTWDPTIQWVSPYNSQADFSSTQGNNQWYYQKWDGTTYSNLTWDAANNRYIGSGYLMVESLRMHPENGSDAVRKWVANTDGIVRVKGYIQNPDAGGDGVTVTLLNNGTSYWSRNVGGSDMAKYTFDIPVTVKKNDILYIRVNKNTTLDFDSIHVVATIRYDQLIYRASEGFSSVQGKEMWSYKSLSGSTYTSLTWNPTYQNWVFGTYGSITSSIQHPETTSSSVRQWQAPFTGKVRITGSVSKQVSGGDGIQAAIRKNGTSVWSRYIVGEKLGNYPDSAFYHDVTVSVNQGDTIDFEVGMDATLDYDGTVWDPILTYIP